MRRTGAADAHWHAGGPAPPAVTGPGWARAASPARIQGQQGLEASGGPGGVTKIGGGGWRAGAGAEWEGRGRRGRGRKGTVLPTLGTKGELSLALIATQCHQCLLKG